jgi:hypothetical protein
MGWKEIEDRWVHWVGMNRRGVEVGGGRNKE